MDYPMENDPNKESERLKAASEGRLGLFRAEAGNLRRDLAASQKEAAALERALEEGVERTDRLRTDSEGRTSESRAESFPISFSF